MQHVLNSPGTVGITAEEYVRLQRASENIIQAVSLEEKIDILLGNFVELETDLLSAATRNAVYERYDYMTLRTERNFMVRRRLLNLLAASRAYIDQGVHDLKRIVKPNDGTLTDFSKIFKGYSSKEYDAILGYRVMEALRNYIQHRGFPIYTSYEERRVHIPDGEAWVYHVKPQIYLKVLKADPNFKREVLAELEEKVEMINEEGKIDAMPLVRTYLEGLSNIQMQIRRDISETTKLSEKIMEDVIEVYAAKYGDEFTSSLVATEYDDGWVKGAQVHLLRTNIVYRNMLSNKDSNLERLSRRFVSSAKLTQR